MKNVYNKININLIILNWTQRQAEDTGLITYENWQMEVM
jgi:hypothetical protein